MKSLPTWVEVDLDVFEANLKTIAGAVGDGVRLLLTVKADAYGHGAVQIAEAARTTVSMFGVATLDEAAELRDAGVPNPILILSPILETEIPALVEGGFLTTISSFGIAERLSQYATAHGATVGVHVEVDTGMGRTGIPEEFAVEEVARISRLGGLLLAGVYTHFPGSDTDPDYTRDQVERFENVIASLREAGVETGTIHAANSGAVGALPVSHFDMVRPGLAAYGLHPSRDDGGTLDVRPILSWKSRLVRVRRFPAGRSISYGRTFVTERESVIGVVPVGYGHGYPFRTSGEGHMLVDGRPVPIVGRVTMDMTMVDLTDLPQQPDAGTEVVLVGRQGDAEITFHDIAGWCGTICYEVMCGISKRVPRTYFRKGRVATFKSLLGVLPNNVAV